MFQICWAPGVRQPMPDQEEEEEGLASDHVEPQNTESTVCEKTPNCFSSVVCFGIPWKWYNEAIAPQQML